MGDFTDFSFVQEYINYMDKLSLYKEIMGSEITGIWIDECTESDQSTVSLPEELFVIDK